MRFTRLQIAILRKNLDTGWLGYPRNKHSEYYSINNLLEGGYMVAADARGRQLAKTDEDNKARFVVVPPEHRMEVTAILEEDLRRKTYGTVEPTFLGYAYRPAKMPVRPGSLQFLRLPSLPEGMDSRKNTWALIDQDLIRI